MEMTPIWRIRSGRFAGWYSSDALYDSTGHNIGYMAGISAFSLSGEYLGDIHAAEWIGCRADTTHISPGPRKHFDNVAHAPLNNRQGLKIDGWDDPNF